IGGGMVTTLAGPPPNLFNYVQTGTADGIGDVVRVYFPISIPVNSIGTLYVADSGRDVIRKLTAPSVLSVTGLSGTIPGSALATLPGLSPDTTYYYRVVANNAAGSAAGIVMSFVTPGAPTPPTATTQVPKVVTPTTATLDATVNPNGNTIDTFFQYSTD